MDGWDSQKMLDAYIHDYMLRKNMRTTARIFAQEANFQPEPVAMTSPEGFLMEWWPLFWNEYSEPPKNLQEEASTSKAPMAMSDGCMWQNSQPALPMPDSYMMQNICPKTPHSGLPNLLQPINPTPMPSPDMGSFQEDAFMPMTPNMDDIPFQFGQTPVSISHYNSVRQEPIMEDLVAQKLHEQEHHKLPSTSFDTNNANALNQLASMLPLASGSSCHGKKVSRKRQRHVNDEINYDAGPSSLRRHVTPHAPKLIEDDIGQADAVTLSGGKMAEKIASHRYSSTGLSYAEYVLSENSTNMASPTLSSDGSKGKGVQIKSITEKDRPLDEEIASENISVLKQGGQAFSFGPVIIFYASSDRLTCCDFSSNGKYLISAGLEQKVIIWNLSQSTCAYYQAHDQLITDVRFSPNSNIFATCSLDRAVKIWDADHSGKILFNLVGHGADVMSVDFHPTKANLVCSCDCSDEIRLWNVESSCSRYFKGGNRMVRFQPGHGNLLAAATGNVINLIDVETGMIQYRFEGHEEGVNAICWDVCGEFLVSVSEESARIWSIVSGGECIDVLFSSDRDFTSCTFHPVHSQVVAVGSYKFIYIWKPTMGNGTWKFQGHRGIISAMANAPEKKMIASVSHDRCVTVWK